MSVPNWETSSDNVYQEGGVAVFDVSPLGVEYMYQEVSVLNVGDTVRLTFDLVAFDGTGVSGVVASLLNEDMVEVLAQRTESEPGTYTLTATVPASGVVVVVFRVFNTHAELSLTAEIDNAFLQRCTTNESSFPGPEPDPELCPNNPVWEGFLVTGNINCLIDVLRDCNESVDLPVEEQEMDVLFLVDSTASMATAVATLQAMYTDTLELLTALLSTVDFQWSVAAYKDTDDGPPYSTLGIHVLQLFTTSTADTAVNMITASGGGDTPDDQFRAIKYASENWLSGLGGRAGATKLIVWIGDSAAHEGGSYPTFLATKAAAVAAGVKVCAINLAEAEAGIDTARRARQLVLACGGRLNNSVDGTSETELSNSIVTAAIQLAESSSQRPHIIYGPAYVEPSRTQNLSESYVRSIVAVNQDRTRATASEGCREPCFPFTVEDYYTVCQCVSGDVRFDSGYNVNVRQDNNANAIIIDAEPGSGLGFPCVETAIHPGEMTPNGFNTLSGSLLCDEIVRSINGIGGRNFLFQSGTGVEITAQPEKHRIIIDVNMHSLALAPIMDPQETADCFQPSIDPCDCGPLDLDEFECPDPAPTTTTTTPNPASTTTTTSTPPPTTTTTTPPPTTTTTTTQPPIPCLLHDPAFDEAFSTSDNAWGIGLTGGCGSIIATRVALSSPALDVWCTSFTGDAAVLSRMGIGLVAYLAANPGSGLGCDVVLIQVLSPKPALGQYRLEFDYIYLRGRVSFQVAEGGIERIAGRIDQYFYVGVGGPIDECEAKRFISSPFTLLGEGSDNVSVAIQAHRDITTSGYGVFLAKNVCLVHEDYWD